MLDPGEEVAFGWPSFPSLRASTRSSTARRGHGAAATTPRYDLDALLEASRRARSSSSSAPEQPDGRHGRRAALTRFLDALPAHVLPVVDEAYFEYVTDPDYPDTIVEHVLEGRRVGVIRTFSKIYGLAGLRVG